MDYLNIIKKKKKHNKTYFKNLLSKVLICIIIILCSIIYNKQNTKTNLIQKYLFNKNITFSNINNLYNKYLGSVLPFNKLNKITKTVFNNSNILNIEDYYDGSKLTLDDNNINALESGIVVYIGNKDNYNKTIIIQGTDGIDIWYGNILETNIELYDSIEKNDILGAVNNKEMFILIKKDSEVIKYEKYIEEN